MGGDRVRARIRKYDLGVDPTGTGASEPRQDP